LDGDWLQITLGPKHELWSVEWAEVRQNQNPDVFSGEMWRLSPRDTAETTRWRFTGSYQHPAVRAAYHTIQGAGGGGTLTMIRWGESLCLGTFFNDSWQREGSIAAGRFTYATLAWIRPQEAKDLRLVQQLREANSVNRNLDERILAEIRRIFRGSTEGIAREHLQAGMAYASAPLDNLLALTAERVRREPKNT
jgi:hypothetical protein